MVYQNMYWIDTRTGKPADPATTPEEYVEIREEEPREVDYTVCALVKVPYAMTFRYSGLGYDTILPAERMREDCGAELIRKFYLFDTPDMEAENAAERYLAELTAGDTSVLMYESKASIRSEFEQFQKMFFLLGGVLCAIIGHGRYFKFLQCDHDRNPCKKKRVCSVTVGWNDKPPVKADACAGRAVLHCRFCGGGVSSVFGLRTTIRRHDGEDVLVLHLSFHPSFRLCDASGVCSARAA